MENFDISLKNVDYTDFSREFCYGNRWVVRFNSFDHRTDTTRDYYVYIECRKVVTISMYVSDMYGNTREYAPSFDRLPKCVQAQVMAVYDYNETPFFEDESEEVEAEEEEESEETMYIVEGVSIVGVCNVTVDNENTVHGSIALNVHGETVRDQFHVHHANGLRWVIFGLDTNLPTFSPFVCLMKHNHGVNMYNLDRQKHACNALMHYVSDML